MIRNLALIVMLAAGLGCQSSLFTYRGSTARPENRLALIEHVEREGLWRTADVQVAYHLIRKGDRLKVSADVVLDRSLRHNFAVTQYFFLRINLLDTSGQVLESKLVLSAGYREAIRKWRVNRELALPAGTTAVAFSYSGKLRQRRSTTWTFWRHP